LGLWLGRGQQASSITSAASPLSASEWHLAVAVSDGQTVTLYADGQQVASTAAGAGHGSGTLEMAPEPLPTFASAHLSAADCRSRSIANALTAEQVKALPPPRRTFRCATYEEASQHWPVQTRAMVGQSAPQDPIDPAARQSGIPEACCQAAACRRPS
jgi:hypothetical protein